MNNYLSFFSRQLSNSKSRMTIIDADIEYDANQITLVIDFYISFLLTQNLSKGDRVVLIGCRNLESIAFFHALLFLNLVPVLVDQTLAAHHLKMICQGESAVFSSSPSFSAPIDFIAVPSAKNADLHSRWNLHLSPVPSRNKDIIFVTHTSGTTGLPKKVAYTNENILWAINEYGKIYKLTKNSRVLFAMPFHYCFGIIACCLSPLCNGSTVVLLREKQETKEIAAIIQNQRIGILAINPFIYSELCKMNLSEFDFSSLNLCDSGGETLPIPVIQKFKSLTNALITEGYGLTETSSLTHFLLPDAKGQIKLGSIGKPCTKVDCKIVNEFFRKVMPYSIGELLVRGPMVIKSYDDPKNNSDNFINGWFRTGDLFYRDDEGYYYLIGRKKDLQNVDSNLTMIANTFASSLAESSKIGDVTFKFLGPTELQIYIVPRVSSLRSRERINEFIRASIPSELREITFVRFVSKLPRTATGKVLRRNL